MSHSTDEKHTPGPWRLMTVPMVMHPTRDGVAIANLCVEFVPSEGYHNENRQEAMANARLIAAAPDLLEALTIARSMLPKRDDELADAPLYDKIDAAITRATQTEG